MLEPMKKETAIEFFSEFYYGEHHFPAKLQPWGDGWCINHYGQLATFDFNELTRLVFMAHDKCIRVGIEHGGPRALRIAIWPRLGEGSMSTRHPDIETALKQWNERK